MLPTFLYFLETANRVHATHIFKKTNRTGNRSPGFTQNFTARLIFRAFVFVKRRHRTTTWSLGFFPHVGLAQELQLFFKYTKSCWLKTPNITCNIDKIVLKLCANNNIGNTQHDTVGFLTFFPPLRRGEREKDVAVLLTKLFKL